MKRGILLLVTLIYIAGFAQEQKDETEKKKGKTFGEKIGNFAGNLMASKTDELDNVALTATIISGVYDLRTNTSETKYFPEGTCEGDYVIGLTFFKNEGMGVLNLKGTVLCDGKPMDYIGIGSYMMGFPDPFTDPKKIEITSGNGDHAEFFLTPIPDIEIVSINGDRILPIVDLSEDLVVEFTNPPGSENTTISAGMLTDIMGARAFNFFADFPAKTNKVTIPKEALSNLAISGKMNAGNINKGENFFALERMVKQEKTQLGPDQQPGDIPAVTLVSKAYSTWPVIVKGRQEEGVVTQLNFSGKFSDEKIGFEVHKPSAKTGIPFSRGSQFGLASLTLNGRLYHEETHSSSSEYTVGNTRYVQTTTWTTVLEFPELPDEYWDNMLEALYTEVTALFTDKFNISFVDVEKVIGTSQYGNLFSDAEVNTYTKISRTYKNTRRMNPRSLGEVLSHISTSQSTETPVNMMMREAGIDGLLSMDINLDIAADKKNHVVLIPSINFSIIGMDETKENRNGTYAVGTIRFREGIPFSSDVVKANPHSLVTVCNVEQMVACLDYVLTNLKAKEVEMGFDKIWSIGE